VYQTFGFFVLAAVEEADQVITALQAVEEAEEK
jgi:hypothetical protein